MKKLFSALALATLFSFFPAHAEKAKQKAPTVDLRQATKKVDQLISAMLKEQKVKPNADIDDATFVRRAFLDIAGRIPTIEEAEDFHGSDYENKRERLISDLLESEGFVSHSYNFWADILRINRQLGNGAGVAEAGYQLWLKDSIRENKPYDEFVRELVAAKGKVWDNGAIGYYFRDRGMPLDNMSNTVRIFLGTRLECAQCHNHPFDKWTQMDYFHMAAFSYGMNANNYDNENRSAMRDFLNDERKSVYQKAVRSEKFPMFRREQDIDKYIDREKGRGAEKFQQRLEYFEAKNEKDFRNRLKKGIAALDKFNKQTRAISQAESELYRQVRYIENGERQKDLKLPHDYQYDDAKPHDVVEPKTMFGTEIDFENIDQGMIDAYAKWMTTRDNPTFTKVIANRLWKRVFGVGVFEPVDELTDHTQISNPELMTYLEGLIRDLNYDTRAYLEVLYNTQAYQRAADSEELVLGLPYYFQGPTLRRMTAEQIWDSIVALALPEADGYRPRLKSQLQQVNKAKLIYESLTEIEPEEYVAMVKDVGNKMQEIIPKQDRLRDQMYKAREAENEELYRKLRTQSSDLQREMYQYISKVGHKKLHQEMSGEELLASLGMSEMGMGAMGMGMGARPQNAVLTKLPRPKSPEPPEGLDKKQLSNWKRQLSYDMREYSGLVSKMARASELESPAPRGHFLREFGQSDREVIENAAQNASVPQALNLLNGSMVEVLTNKFAVFGSRIHDVEDPTEKAKLIFQGMLTREPTEQEMEVALAEIDAHGEKGYHGIVWALLNTQQFLFVQ